MFHLFSFYAIVVGWTACAAIFILQRKRTRDGTKRSDPASVIGLALQSVAFALVWLGHRHPGLSIFAFGRWFEFLLLVIAVTLLIGSLWVCSAAVRVLGKQWSLQARVLEDHKLVREGPYRFVRHPIYTGMLGMIMAAGLAWSHWIGFLIALILFTIGTAIRVRSEEKLLREQFGAAFDDYKRSVPGVVPIKF